LSSRSESDELTALIVDDDELFRTRLGRAFEARGWEVFLGSSLAEAVCLVRENAPSLIIVDLRLNGESGLDIVRALRPLDPTMSIIVLTGWGSIATAVEAVRDGADHYLSKPVDADQIIAVFESLPATTIATDAPSVVPSLARVEWEHIQRVLTDCRGNISMAAKQLGLHRRSLQRKLAKYPPRV